MTRLRRGARQLVDQLLADLEEIAAAASELAEADQMIADMPRSLVKFNPDLIADNHHRLRGMIADARSQFVSANDALRRRIRDELEPMLVRNEQGRDAGAVAQIEELRQTIAALTRRVEELERSPPRVVPFKQNNG